MKKKRYEIIIFCVNFVAMILELVASRILSPYFGNSNIVWTSVIGIILLSGSIGNYYGGKIADLDKESSDERLKIILFLSGISIGLIPFIQTSIINLILKLTSNVKIGAVIVTTLLFLTPSIFIGLLTPIVLKLKSESMDTVGNTFGRITALATIGGIIGTFVGGFFLIPNYGSVYILFILAVVILLLVPVVDCKMNYKKIIYIVFISILGFSAFKINLIINDNNIDFILNGEENKKYYLDTQYGRVKIFNTRLDNEKVRMLNIDGGYQSATYIDEDKRNELVFDVTQKYNLIFNSSNNIKDVLMIGGGGYSYPKYFISHFEDKNMDVVEIDGKVTEIAKKYFYLNELIYNYNLNENKRLNLITEDGRIYLNSNTKKYDAILIDAFSGDIPSKTLTTIECIQHIKDSLNPNGLYLANIISAIEGKDSKFIKAEVNTLKQAFKHVYIFQCIENYPLESIQNNIVIATDDDSYKVEKSVELNINDDEIILTDDYCPVEALAPKK